MKTRILPFIFMSLACAAGLGAAQLGDPAKPLDVKEWVKGAPVDLAAGKGKGIFVVEFWATWCSPCRASIPHLTELQKRFKEKGVVFVGISDETPDLVKKFVEQMGDKMDYTVGIDGGGTSEGYMKAFGARGIPHAFIVDKEGRIAWEGHPMAKMDEVIEALIAGKYDMEKARKREEARRKFGEYVQLSMDGSDPERVKTMEEELAALEKEVGGVANGEKFDAGAIRKRIEFSKTFMKYQELVLGGEGDTNEIARLEKQLEGSAPKDFNFKQIKEDLRKAGEQARESARTKAMVDDYIASVGEGGNPEKAAAQARKLEALGSGNATLFNEVAWAILTDEGIKVRDVKLALRLAKRAVEETEAVEPGILDTYARALFDNGAVTEAIAQQKKAVELMEDEAIKAELKATLGKYEARAKEAAKPETR